MLGLVVNMANTPLEVSASVLTPLDIDNHLAYAAQQCLDGYAEAVHHVIRRKAMFNKKVVQSKAGVAIFKKGQLVQVHCSDLMNTLSTDCKLQPSWSGPYCIQDHLLNSYKLEELDGMPKTSEFSARHLHAFTPREGMDLAREQRVLEDRLAREEGEIEGLEGLGLRGTEWGGEAGQGGELEQREDSAGVDEGAYEPDDETSNIASHVSG